MTTPITTKPILITGATGYIGGRLVAPLLEHGYRVRCLARDPRKLSGRGWDQDPRVEIVRGDVLDRESICSAMEGCGAAYYLVHSMLAGERAFEDNVPPMAHGFTVTARLGAPLAAGTVGVVAEQGDYNGGWVWFALGDELTFACSFVSEYVTRLSVPLPVGATRLQLVGRRSGDGFDVACAADGARLGEVRLPHEWPGLWTPSSAASLLAGCGRPLPVCDGYDPTVPFGGVLDRLVVEADRGRTYDELAHQVETAFRSQ